MLKDVPFLGGWALRTMFFCAAHSAAAGDGGFGMLHQRDSSAWSKVFMVASPPDKPDAYFAMSSKANAANSNGDEISPHSPFGAIRISNQGASHGCPNKGESVDVRRLLHLLLDSETQGGKVDRSLETEFISRNAVYADYFVPRLTTATSYVPNYQRISSAAPSARSNSLSQDIGVTFNLPTDTKISFGISKAINEEADQNSKNQNINFSISQAIGKNGLSAKSLRISSDLRLRTAIITWKEGREGLFVDAYTKLFNILSARKDLTMQRDLLKAAEATRDLQRVRRQAGFLSQNELLQAESAVRSAQVQLRQSEFALNTIYRDVVTNLGCQSVPYWDVPDFEFPSLDVAPLKAELDDLIPQSVLQHKIRIMQTDLDWQGRQLARQKLPDIYLTFSRTADDSWDQLQSNTWSKAAKYTLSLSMPIVDLPERYRQKANAIQLRTQQVDLDLKKANLMFDVQDLFRQSELSDETLFAATDQIEFARLRYDQELVKYRIGQTTSQNLELAQQNLTSAQRTYRSQQLSSFTAKIAVFRSLGKLRDLLGKIGMEQVYWLRWQDKWIDPDFLLEETWLH